MESPNNIIDTNGKVFAVRSHPEYEPSFLQAKQHKKNSLIWRRIWKCQEGPYVGSSEKVTIQPESIRKVSV
jgi:hypothetical protein